MSAPDSRPLRLGVMGVGNIGSVHLQSARAMPGCRVVAAADADPAMRERASDLGVPTVYGDYADLVAAGDVDAVVVALPPALHAEATVAACEAGLHAFVEKPLAPTLEECDRMLAAADEAGVALGVDHTVRYQPEFRRLKERYDRGDVGHVPLATIRRINDGPFSPPPASESVPAWRLADHPGAGAVFDLGVHLFDVVEWFFGPCTVRHAETRRQLDLPYEDTATVLLEADTGALVTVHVGYFQWEEPPDVNTDFRLEGVADSDSAGAHLPRSFALHAASSALGNVARRLTGQAVDTFEPTHYYRAHYDALAAFVDAVAAGERPPVDGEAGRRAVELVLETYRCAEASATEDADVADTVAADPPADSVAEGSGGDDAGAASPRTDGGDG